MSFFLKHFSKAFALNLYSGSQIHMPLKKHPEKVIGKNNSDSILCLFPSLQLLYSIALLQVKNVACSLKYTGWPTLKTLTFKGIINIKMKKEKWIWSLSWKDPLVKEMATHSNVLAWEIPRTEEPGGLQWRRYSGGDRKSQTELSN